MKQNNYVIRQSNDTWEVLYITDQRSVPLNNCEVLPGIVTDYPKVVDHGEGKLEIVDDTERREVEEYRDSRRAEYPPIMDQLELISDILKHLNDNGTNIGEAGESYLSKIDAVKVKYAKPEKLKDK